MGERGLRMEWEKEFSNEREKGVQQLKKERDLGIEEKTGFIN